ncbi:hypothetical protein LJR225_004371 [Phenylobacterium sp. LjRoot225]|uniref:hypothetical protein n=1 Tax=Phenylobacterium sp. LjRoot225 TaxID=3342285 RepID=UPI003ED05551
MTNRNFTALGALALGLSIATSAAFAQPYGKGGNYALAPTAQASVQDDHRGHMRDAQCDCSMMNGAGSMRDQCMSMSGDHRGATSQPGQPG